MGSAHTVSVQCIRTSQIQPITSAQGILMSRTTRIVAFSLVASTLAACSSNPVGPTAARCDARTGKCANADYVNPNVDYVNPNIDYINPNVDYVNPNI